MSLVGPDGKEFRDGDPPPAERNPLWWPHQDARHRARRQRCPEMWVKSGGTCGVCGSRRPPYDGLHVPSETMAEVSRGALDAIAAFLDGNPGETWTVWQVARHFKWDRKYAAKALSSAYRMGLAFRIAYGVYASFQNRDGYIVRF